MSKTRRDATLVEALLRPHPHLEAGKDWWRGAMIYEIYVRSFRDSNKDGIGDLRGVTEQLDYLEKLGIDAFWLSPVYPSPLADFGYDVTDFFAVDPTYGTLEDLIELVDGAHKRGLRVLMDFIPCHTSIEHPWFLESRCDRTNPRADWYVWAEAADDGGPPNNWLSSFGGGAWQWEPRRAQYYYHPFLTSQPALNLRNADVMRAIADAMRFWFDTGIDGFRIDAIQCLCWDRDLRSNPPRASDSVPMPFGGGPNNPFARQEHLFDRDVPDAFEILAQLRAVADEYDNPRVLIGELADVDSTRQAVKYTAGEDRLHAVYDFSVVHLNQTWETWTKAIKTRSEHIGGGWQMTAFTNHDSTRAVSNLTAFAEEAGKRVEAAKLLLFLQATLRGGGIIYQGEELGLPQPHLPFEELRDQWGINLWPDFEGRDGVRTPIPWVAEAKHAGFTDGERPWLTVADGHAELAVDRQQEDAESVLCFLRALLAWRRDEPMLLTGDERISEVDHVPVLLYERSDGSRRLTFAANFSLTRHAIPMQKGTLVDVPGASARMENHSLDLPPLGFACLEDAELYEAGLSDRAAGEVAERD